MATLNHKQLAFCSEFTLDRNATQAAIRAGYSKRSARQIANQLLSKHDIQAQLQEQYRETEARLQISRDDVLRGLLSAFQMAREQQAPMAMIAAMREVGKMLGYYEPESRRVELSATDELFQQHLAQMPEKELLRLARGGGDGGG